MREKIERMEDGIKEELEKRWERWVMDESGKNRVKIIMLEEGIDERIGDKIRIMIWNGKEKKDEGEMIGDMKI